MNTITKEIILERLNRFKNIVDELGGTTSKIICKEVAREEEILDLEKELGHKLPDDFRWTLLNVSSHLARAGLIFVILITISHMTRSFTIN